MAHPNMIGISHRISALQFAMTLGISSFGLGAIYFPRILTLNAGSASFLSFAIVALLAGLSLGINLRLALLSRHVSLSELHMAVLGRIAGGLMETLLALFLILYMAATVFEFTNMLHTFFYPLTPPWAIVCALMLLVAITASSPPEVMVRTVQATVVPSLLLLVVGMILLIPILRFPPAMALGVDIRLPRVEAGVYVGLYQFTGSWSALYLVPHLIERKPRRIALYAYAGLGASVVILAASLFTTLSLFGVHHTPMMLWPFATAMRVLTFPGFFINRFGVLVLISWTAILYNFLSLQTWCVGKLLHTTFATVKGSRGRYGLGVAIAVTVAALLLPSEMSLQAILTGLILPGTWLFTLVLPALYLLVATLRRRHLRATLDAARTRP